MQRTLVIRIPLNDSDPVDIVSEVDDTSKNGEEFLVNLVRREFTDCELTVESGDKVRN